MTTDENVIRYELAREELLQMEDLNEEMSVKMVVLTEENDKLTRQNEELRRQSSQSSSDRHDLISKLDDIETEVQGLRKKNSQLEQRNLNLEHRIKNLNELRDLDKQKESELSDTVDDVKAKNRELSGQISTLSSSRQG